MIVKICPLTSRACEHSGCAGPGCMLQPTPPIVPYTAPHMGWQCPKCGRGNAPFVHQCPCGPNYITWAGTGVTIGSTGGPSNG